MLSDHLTSLISLNLSTPFFDMGLMSAISRIGAFGTLRHLEFATTGTKLTAEGLKEAVEGCRGLQSLTLHDVEGALRRFDGGADFKADWTRIPGGSLTTGRRL